MRVHFTNLGCKLNQAEIERLGRQLEAGGHRVVASLAEADVHVVNSCTVTHVAARRSRRAAGMARRSGRPVRTVLTGCYASGSPEEAARLAGVDLVVPNAEKDLLVERILAAFPELAPPEPIPCSSLPAGPTRALVKVEDGCNMRCSFCIIPFTRGAQRSRPAPEVIAEVRDLAARGYREIVITGVQISAWRSEEARLADLVRQILAETDVSRLRLTSIAPWDLDERILDLWSEASGRLCRHLHLSLQSGATATLRRMRRPYTAEGYLALLGRVRAAVPGVAVTTDVIVGFPGETAEEFAASLDTVEAAGFAKIHVFPYSSRPGTAAEGMPHHVPSTEKKERMAQMLAAAGSAEREFQRAHLGRRATVLWEKPKDGMGQGLTDNYLRVVSHEGADLWNRFSEVELTEIVEEGVVGRIVG
ncbi:MAG TPA: tRNA (N(6)-L-threonylcarbamoyladenosine(37)-C(2))-methylthiotransferase MtaB [Thermoanaerobaculia bacterium]|nr:tRNA (N(6)-L-threonylcarbamoyladenosine(37)-C(2))-methylthiotransferase MtaB [Thermoanaerobaculia bacterium]